MNKSTGKQRSFIVDLAQRVETSQLDAIAAKVAAMNSNRGWSVGSRHSESLTRFSARLSLKACSRFIDLLLEASKGKADIPRHNTERGNVC